MTEVPEEDGFSRRRKSRRAPMRRGRLVDNRRACPSLWFFSSCWGAALLETVGDALVRTGLRGPGGAQRLLWIAGGGLVLLTYGILVNTPDWHFGRLLGVYVVLFFVVAQLIGWLCSTSHRPHRRSSAERSSSWAASSSRVDCA